MENNNEHINEIEYIRYKIERNLKRRREQQRLKGLILLFLFGT